MPENQGPSRLQIWLGVGLIVLFVAALVALVLLRDDPQWDRLVFLLQGLEALVFAAAGVLFGTAVGRSSAAVQEVAQAQERAAVAETDAANGRALASAVLASEEQSARRGSREPATAAESDLAALARRLFPNA
ncbi:hypothetical protein GT755_05585 [Herbidospora sp. NEAU-GS84]|uniref:Uncharacterized protein n=1 Tax=Herbidospora solisilvae TaxID=2696284 RepID=A0A7C9JRD4_9ACTN|nr:MULTISPECIES: hypothetical protein [Herbidospora]NAS21159.1 hypothetical protein [Herbidospora solisilvae]